MMKKTVLFLIFLSFSLSADFFQSEKKAEEKQEAERKHFCEFFTDKAIAYEKTMRNDELANITLHSYKKRADIYCGRVKEVKETVKEEKVKIVVQKNIALEDKRLCEMFNNKITDYQKNMRNDELAHTTLASYKQRAYIFCSNKPLEKKEAEVLNEDQKLCELFNYGPSLCKVYDKKTKSTQDDELAIVTFKSYTKRANVFCSSEPLKAKDEKVYQEHKRLCQVFNDKITAYKKTMRKDRLAHVTLESYKQRANYFCSSKKVETK
jgi:hypothetical protein